MMGATVWVAAISVAAQRVTWHNSWCAALVSLITVTLYVTARTPGRPLHWVAVGSALGVTALMKQTFGAALVVGIVLHRLAMCALGRDLKPLAHLTPISLGLVGVLSAWGAYMFLHGALSSFLQLVILYPLGTMDLTSSLATPTPPLGPTRGALLFYLPPVLLALLGGHSVWRTRGQGDIASERMAYVILALCLYIALFPSGNYSHLRPILPVTLIVLAPVAGGVVRQLPGRVQHLARINAASVCSWDASTGCRP